MENKPFKGKAIRNPSGRAGEYNYWACDFYKGCEHDCQYCYCKRGVLSTQWTNSPVLKSCFKDEYHALDVFTTEVFKHLTELREHGLFFNFISDPFQADCFDLNLRAITFCNANNIPVKILTKKGEASAAAFDYNVNKYKLDKSIIAYGTTLTGCDNLEPGAPNNKCRHDGLKFMNKEGYPTFASIEPAIVLKISLEQISKAIQYCDLFKVGLLSNKKYDIVELKHFINIVIDLCKDYDRKVYFKDSLLKQAGIDRDRLSAVCVKRDYNIWNGKK